jgi:hypothetical protein
MVDEAQLRTRHVPMNAVFRVPWSVSVSGTETDTETDADTASAADGGRRSVKYHVRMKWLGVAAILAYVALRVFVYFNPKAPISRAFRRRYLLRTDADAMSRRELVLSALSFLGFAVAAAAIYFGVVWGGAELGWRLFDARPVVVLGKAGLFIGAMALAACVFLLGAALFRSEEPKP